MKKKKEDAKKELLKLIKESDNRYDLNFDEKRGWVKTEKRKIIKFITKYLFLKKSILSL